MFGCFGVLFFFFLFFVLTLFLWLFKILVLNRQLTLVQIWWRGCWPDIGPSQSFIYMYPICNHVWVYIYIHTENTQYTYIYRAYSLYVSTEYTQYTERHSVYEAFQTKSTSQSTSNGQQNINSLSDRGLVTSHGRPFSNYFATDDTDWHTWRRILLELTRWPQTVERALCFCWQGKIIDGRKEIKMLSDRSPGRVWLAPCVIKRICFVELS